MAGHYLKLALRSLLAGRMYSVLNVLGLAVAMACCILIFGYVRNEFSYDRFYPDAERIYRVAVERTFPNETIVSARTPRSLAAALAEDWPEVAEATRLSRERAARVLVAHQDTRFYEDGVLFADPNFFDVFALPLVAGDADTALQAPFSLVITESAARRYFGSADPIGRTLTLRLVGDGDLFEYAVTAVARDVPANSHFSFDFLASYQGHPFATTDGVERTNFEALDVYTYVKLQAGSAPAVLESRFPQIVRERLGASIEARGGQGFDRYVAEGNSFRYFLQPLTSIHLRSRLGDELGATGALGYVLLFIGIACAILALACINFANLVTARASTRSREVGVHKSFGAQRRQLVCLFLFESILLSLVALVPTVGLVEALAPLLARIEGAGAGFVYADAWRLAPALIGFALLVGLLAGLYPALHLASLRPAMAARSGAGTPLWSLLRSGLVIFQFAVSLALMVSTVVIAYQMRYVAEKQLGFDSEQVIVLEGTEVLRRQPGAFTDAVRRVDGVVAVTHGENLPGRTFESAVVRVDGSGAAAQVERLFAGIDYVDTLGMAIVEGRDFAREFPSDAMAALLNERAVQALGLQQPLGARVTWASRTYTVIGVVQDFHYASLHDAIGPLMLTGLDPEFENRPYQYFAVRVDTDDMTATLAALQQVWREFAPQQPFSYTFLDADLGLLYGAERKSAALLGTLTGIAFFIACLGLFGLASFNTLRRRKEIGVRKVMGGSVWSIVLLLTNDFSKLVLIANLIAWPVAYFAMSRWLENFAYRIDLTPLIFIGSGLIALCIAWVTVGGTAAQKPVLALRYE